MTNQHTRNDVLYRSPSVKGRQTELRRAGDNLVLYTEDTEVYNRFRVWHQLRFVAPYYQGYIFSTKDRRLVAADLYFRLSAKQDLLKALNEEKVADPPKEGVSQAR